MFKNILFFCGNNNIIYTFENDKLIIILNKKMMKKLNNLKLNELRDAIFLSAEDLRKFKGGYAGLTYYSCNNGTTYIVPYATCYGAYDNPSDDPNVGCVCYQT
jgi:natural product precursor